MGKTKEQCTMIISQNFKGKEENESCIAAIEKSIKEICAAEHALLWCYNKEDNSVQNLMQQPKKVFKLHHKSILEDVMVSQKGFFDNHVASHRHFNPIIDNPLNLNIKSLLVLPILNLNKDVIGAIVAYNSVSHSELFQRYDLRCLTLLNKQAIKIIEFIRKIETPCIENNQKRLLSQKNIVNDSTTKKSIPKKSIEDKITKVVLENLLDEKEAKIAELEKALILKEEELNALQDVNEVELVDEKKNKQGSDVIENIFKFLNNEVTYFANEEHKIYLLLEIIKKSLHNKEQLSFIDNQISQSQLVENLANELYTKGKLVLKKDRMNSYATLLSVINMYVGLFCREEILFNVFIDPQLPSEIEADEDKIKSVLIHLINNVHSLVGKKGVIELAVSFLEETESLTIKIKSLKEKERNGLFRGATTTHSLITGDTGLGLNISSNLVNVLEGKLKLSTVGKDAYLFMVTFPVTVIKKKEKRFHTQKALKIGILADKNNMLSLKNLESYLESFGISKSNIMIFNNYKKMNSSNCSHFFCFENMLSTKFTLTSLDSLTILKYSQEDMREKYNLKREVNELLINSYYGQAIQQMLFPEIEVEELDRGTLIGNESFLGKLKRLYSK